MMIFFQRLKNLWMLSRFTITEFDNQLVITKEKDALVFARPKQAQIIKRIDPLDEIIL